MMFHRIANPSPETINASGSTLLESTAVMVALFRAFQFPNKSIYQELVAGLKIPQAYRDLTTPIAGFPPNTMLTLSSLPLKLRTQFIGRMLRENKDYKQVLILGSGLSPWVMTHFDPKRRFTCIDTNAAANQRVIDQFIRHYPAGPIPFFVKGNYDEILAGDAHSVIDRSQPLMVIFEGNAMYRTHAENQRLFTRLNQLAPKGGMIVFDYVYPTLSTQRERPLSHDQSPRATFLRSSVVQSFKSGYTPQHFGTQTEMYFPGFGEVDQKTFHSLYKDVAPSEYAQIPEFGVVAISSMLNVPL